MHAASTGSLYAAVLELPDTLTDLEAVLGVDAEDPVRAGFSDSGVAQQGERAIERRSQPSAAGQYYWRSFDALDPSSRLFADRPLKALADAIRLRPFHLGARVLSDTRPTESKLVTR